ncbi:MAG: NfeD family protein [Rhodoferax sp.]
MTQSSIWWVLAGVLIAAELMTGTFYLLMLSIGMAAAAVASHLGAPIALQLVAAAAFGGGSVVGWRSYRKRQPSSAPASANRDVNLDIGETVQVDAWNPDGTACVRHRGANWSVSLAEGSTASAGTHRIVEIIGNRLIVRKFS